MTDIAKWTQQAENGDTEAMRELAEAYENGYGVEKNEDKAQYWYKKRFAILLEGANSGDIAAMWGVIGAYRFGYGVEKDQENARKWESRKKAISRLFGL